MEKITNEIEILHLLANGYRSAHYICADQKTLNKLVKSGRVIKRNYSRRGYKYVQYKATSYLETASE